MPSAYPRFLLQAFDNGAVDEVEVGSQNINMADSIMLFNESQSFPDKKMWIPLKSLASDGVVGYLLISLQILD